MKRTPLRRGKPLRSTGQLARRTRLAGIGRRKAREIEETADWRREYLQKHPACQVGAVLRSAGVTVRCWRMATGLHELQKRSAQGSLVDPNNLLSACSPCNLWVEDNPEKARELGLSVPSWVTDVVQYLTNLRGESGSTRPEAKVQGLRTSQGSEAPGV